MPELNVANLAETLPDNPLDFATSAAAVVGTNAVLEPLAGEALSACCFNHWAKLTTLQHITTVVTGSPTFHDLKSRFLRWCGATTCRAFEDECISLLHEGIMFHHGMGSFLQHIGSRFILREVLTADVLRAPVAAAMTYDTIVEVELEEMFSCARTMMENSLITLLVANHMAAAVENAVLSETFSEKYGGPQFDALKKCASVDNKSAIQKTLLAICSELLRGASFSGEQVSALTLLWLSLNDDLVVAGALERLFGCFTVHS